MALIDLFNTLASKDIQLWLEGDNLQFSAPEGAMTDSLLAQIKAQKPEIIAFLKQHQNPIERLSKAPIAQDYPVSFAQQRFWLLQQLDPDSTAYHIQGNVKISGPLDTQKLAQAFKQLVKKHAILRTAYSQKNGQLRQIFTDFSPELLIKDSHLADKIPFDLSKGDVIRAALTPLSANEYTLDLTVHHIACDGLSLAQLTTELMGLYFAPILPAAPSNTTELQYVDYCVWQATEDTTDSLNYWQAQLKHTPILRLPTDHSPTSYDDQAGFCSIRLGMDKKTTLTQLASEHQTTLFSILLSGYALFLHKTTGQTDFAIGTPVAGRPLPEIETMLGCFINSLAIRFDFDDITTTQDLIEQSKSRLAAAFEHQRIPFEQVVSSLNLKDSVNTPPVFQTLISLIPEASQTMEIDGITIEPQASTAIEAQFDLKLAIQENDGLTISFEYKQSLFDESTIGRFCQYYAQIIQALASNTLLSELTLDKNAPTFLGKGEFNDTQADLNPTCIDTLFDQQANKTPHHIAISSNDGRLTYLELKQHSEQLAAILIERGVKPNDILAIELDRSLDVTVALLATLKVGAAYLPIEPETAPLRKQQIVEQAKPRLIITESTDWEGYTTLSAKSRSDNAFTTIAKSAETLINVIFTSGSTGTPKGVMVSHQAIHNRLAWMQKQFQLAETDVILQKTPIGFDVSVWELFWPIITGARSHFLPPEAHKDPQAIIQTIQQESISHLHFVPSMLSPFLGALKEDLPSIRQVYCSGEALTQPQVDLAYEKLPQITLFNLYGPTEAAIDVSYYACRPNDNHASVPIGRPIDNIQLHILDENLQPTPYGLAGELYIGGIGLAYGYIGRDDLTELQFIDNPLSNHPSAKLYKTGDFARMSVDNQLIYLGRTDGQVKIRGQRVELADVEQRLIQCLDVQQAVAKVLLHPKSEENTLVAFLPINITPEQKQQINQTINPAMQPQFYVAIEQWPLTPSGKINRKALPEPDWTHINQTPYRAPETETEQQLTVIWQNALAIEKIGIDDNFFDLGGHSLKAMEIAGLIQEQFDCQIPLKDLMLNPTIAHIAKAIDQAMAAKSIFASSQPTSDEEQDNFVI
ncbi:MAG: amino acid adenylation domain-containing protein [Cellvibrionales bacterium]|nr:amino acid adenylation domain-containing protein [Cellvibrionales bacterium]